MSMSKKLMFGQPVADAMRAQLLKEGIPATVGIVQVGELPESTSYVKQVQRTSKTIFELVVQHRQLYEGIASCELENHLHELNDAKDVAGYMVQLPLPRHLMGVLYRLRNIISPGKDVDHLGYEHGGGLFHERQPNQIVPPTPYAVMKLLRHYNVETRGKMMAIVGDGEVGRRLKVMAGNDMANQIVLNETVADLSLWTSQADIVVSAAGIPKLITAKHIREGAVVVGVGMKVVDGKIQSDIDVDSVLEKAALVTPRVGGLGPVTVMALLQNVVRAARRKKQS